MSEQLTQDAGASEGTQHTPQDAIAKDEIFGAGLQEAMSKDRSASEDSSEDPFAEQDRKAQEEQQKQEPEKTEEKPKIDLTPKQGEQQKSQADAGEWSENLKVPQKRSAWEEFRTLHNSTVKELEAARTKLAELESKAPDMSKLEELQAKVQEYEQRYKEASLLNDPSLTRDVDAKYTAVAEMAKAQLEEQQGKDFEVIMSMPPGKHRDKMLSDFADDLSPIKQAQLGAFLARVDELRVERNSILKNAKENADALFKQRQSAMEAQKEQQKAQANAVFDSAVSEFKRMDGWKDLFGDEATSKQWLDSARNIYSGNVGSAKDLAKKAILAETAPALLEHAIDVSKQLVEKDAKIAELVNELKGYKDSSRAPNTITSPAQKEEDDFAAGAMRAFTSGYSR